MLAKETTDVMFALKTVMAVTKLDAGLITPLHQHLIRAVQQSGVVKG